jgi:endonuclease G
MLFAMPGRRSRTNGLGPVDFGQVADASLAAFSRLRRSTQIIIVLFFLIGGVLALAIYFHSQGLWVGQNVSTPNLLLGNPSDAGSSDRDNYLLAKPYFVLSYNNDNGTPNWVSWEVTEADLGEAPRKQVFDPDESVPPGFNIVKSSDYSRSGFERGHMCPHSDRAANIEMSYSTFIMTNVIPQAPNVNEKAWAQLEDYCRRLVRMHNHLCIIAGPLGRGGTGSRGFRETLPRGNVVVPAECWKVIVVVPDAGISDDMAKIGPDTRVIAVDMPNDQTQVGEEWDLYRTTPAHIEQKTGLHFFTSVRPELAAILRQELDTEPIPPPRPLGRGREEVRAQQPLN